MKYLLIIVALVLISAGIWYASSMNMKNMNMGGMMMNQTISEKDNLSLLKDSEVPAVKPMEVVELKNGDTYEMVASIVKQTVGNREIKRLAYNGQIPGPVLKAERGAKVTINFINNLDMETALHAHGLRGDYKMDGAVPITPPVKVGETFAYQLEFPDAGAFWYHPHVREDYQQDLGLYGNFIVTEDGYWNEVGQEAYLIVDDVLESGEYSSKTVTNTLMGRFGDQLLINDSNEFNLKVVQGQITRAYITNVANTRTFDLTFEGAETKLVGGDNGRIEKEVMIKNQIIAPSERYIVELYYDTPGTYTISNRGKKMGTVTVEPSGTNLSTKFKVLRDNSSDYAAFRSDIDKLVAKAPDKSLRLDLEMKGDMMDMMKATTPVNTASSTVVLMGIEMTLAQAKKHCGVMTGMEGCAAVMAAPDTPNGGMAEMNMGSMAGMDMGSNESADGIEWEDTMAAMNQMSTKENLTWFMEDTGTKARNEAIDWSFKKGDLVKVRIANDAKGMHPMQHPIHFHGQRFVVLARDGKINDNLQWKDSVLIPAGETVDLLVDMNNPGEWMAHCHISEHFETGMMLNFSVDE